MTIGILCSGELGLNILKKLVRKHEISFIATDKNSLNIIEYNKTSGYKTYVGNPRNGKLLSFLKDKSCDILISINYIYLIEQDVINFPKIFAFNIHGSLLPKYRGRTPHVWAIINNEKECGITAHVIEEKCDTGSILYQKKITIAKKDTGYSILLKYQKNYLSAIEFVLKSVKAKNLNYTQQDENQASFYPKRTPEDGKINWEWKSLDIYNWVRAQSFPYPGAFTFYNDTKIIIDWVNISSSKKLNNIPNGQILKIANKKIYVKCSDGIIKITRHRNNDVFFKENNVLK